MASQHSVPEAHAGPGSRFTGKETGFHTGTPVEDTSDGGVAKRLNHDDTEGVGPLDDEGGAPYPLDDFMVRTEMRTVADAVNRIRKSRYILNPGFQRDYVWDDRRASRLIESCIMRIPLPVIYVAEEPDGRIVVVDGQQRLVTFKRFLADDFPLTKLGEGHPLNGHRFSDLPIYLQERVEDTQLTLNILDHNTPERARLDIFQRVNSGETLTRQQMRNALYYGPGTEWLKGMADDKSFLQATDGTLSKKSMRDREVINRFAAFHLLGYRAYANGDMDEFLAHTIGHMNSLGEEQLAKLSRKFAGSMRRNYELFGKHAFRKSLTGERERRTPINKSLFDVLSNAFARIPDETVSSCGDRIKSCVVKLVGDDDFQYVISYSTNSTSQVIVRFEMTETVLSDYLT